MGKGLALLGDRGQGQEAGTAVGTNRGAIAPEESIGSREPRAVASSGRKGQGNAGDNAVCTVSFNLYHEAREEWG